MTLFYTLSLVAAGGTLGYMVGWGSGYIGCLNKNYQSIRGEPPKHASIHKMN